MSGLADVRIGKKMALVIASGIVALVGVGGLSLWSISAIRDAVGQEHVESGQLMNAQRVGIDLGAINAVVGHMTLSQHCETCHGIASGGDSSDEARTTKECQSLLAGLETHERTAAGKKLLGPLKAAARAWLDVNLRVRDLDLDGKRAAANALYRDESIPSVGPAQQALAGYVDWQQQRLLERRAGADKIMRQLPIPIATLSLLALAISTLLGVLVTRSISVPLDQAVTFLEGVAKGDVTENVKPRFLARQDEIGMLAKAVQTVSNSLRDVIRNMNGGIGTLSSSSAALSADSGRMSDGSRDASGKAHAVAAAAEQMTANVVSIAAGMEQTSTNLGSVATATEQMTATIGEIAGNSEKARRITEDATRQAARISEQMNQLGAAAQQIGKVTETITEISSQTNLLALNATIEAARAGSAGKGFAVVANEIKELAQQTARATEDIKGRIAGVQSSTAGGVAEIDKVAAIIQDVSDIVSSIAAAIEEQSTATKDIARNIAEASTGVRDANKRVSEASQATAEIAREIVVVDHAAAQIADGSERVRLSATELSQVAEQLQTVVSRFRVSGVDLNMLKIAITAHAAWSSQLRTAIATGRLDIPVATVRVDNQCQFGKWLYGEQLSSAEKQTESYLGVKQLHAQFHQAASKVAQFALSGQKEAAENAMNASSDYAKVSAALTAALNNWTAAV